MSIPDPLREAAYRSGELLQQCTQCDWAQCGHDAELATCPQCAVPLGAPLALRFGGFAIVFDGVRFILHDNCGRQVVLQAADFSDALRFLAAHATDFRDHPRIRSRSPRRVPQRNLAHSSPWEWN